MWWRKKAAAGTYGPSATPPGWDPEGLVPECQAFLSGTYLDLLDVDQPLPAWAWVNQLAHGDLASLRETATRPRPGTGPAALIGHLAGQIVDIVEASGVPLEVLQRQTLIPLELELSNSIWQDVTVRDQTQLGRLINAALAAGNARTDR